MKVCILGAGAFGFAIAKLLSDNHEKDFWLYDPVRNYIDNIIQVREHPVFHKGIKLSENVKATHNLTKAVSGAKIIIMAIPGKFVRTGIQNIKEIIEDDVVFVNLAKSLEPESNKAMSQVLSEELTGSYKFAVLSGGMIASEVTKNFPLCADIACEDFEIAKELQKLFTTPYFKVYPTTDVIGVELAGALKNVCAIGAGFFDGLGYKESSKAGFVSEAANEMKQFAVALGAKPETYDVGGHAWLGDLLTTCFGDSRNRYFGELIGKGNSVREALSILEREMKRSEGYLTTESFYKIAKEKNLAMAILDMVYGVLFGDKTAKEAVEGFMKIQ